MIFDSQELLRSDMAGVSVRALRWALIIAAACVSISEARAVQGGGRPASPPASSAPGAAVPRAPRRTPRRDVSPPPPVRKVIPSSLVVKSNPPNCAVSLNGRQAGTTDAAGYLKLTNLKPGQYVLTVSRPDYRDGQSVVDLEPGQEASADVPLIAIPATLNLKAAVPGAHIKIRNVGDFVEQLVGYSIAPGVYSVEVSKNGFRSTTRQLEVSPAKVINVEVPLDPLPEAEALQQAEQFFRGRNYDAAAEVCVVLLSLQPNHPRANLIAGYSHYQAARFGDSLPFLMKAIELSQQVSLPVRHYEKVSSKDQLFAGTLTLQPGSLSYRSSERPGLDFAVPSGRVYELRLDPQKGGRLYAQLGVVRVSGKKEKKEKFYFHPSTSSFNVVGSRSSIECLVSCQQELQAIYRLVLRAKQ